MKSNFEERKANRLEAFQNLAAKNEQLSQSSYEYNSKLADVIPFGQPILVGHHSENRHRNHIKKIHNAMNKSVEAGKKAAYYQGRAESLLNGTAISSDDPNAIDKLIEKAERLEGLQELYKAINKIIKSAKTSPAEKVTLLQELSISEQSALKLLQPDFCGRIGVPSYKLTNNNANIRTVRQRIEHLSKVAAIVSSEEEINGVTLIVSSEDNRVKIKFPGIPSEEVRKDLKGHGFHWSPSEMAWMRQITEYAIWIAKQIINRIPN